MKKNTFLLSALSAALLACSISHIPAYADNSKTPVNVTQTMMAKQPLPSLAPMLEHVLPSVVTVNISGKKQQESFIPEEFKFFFGQDFDTAPREFKGLGSGVIIDADKGYVLTNNHVIENADKITLTLQDGRELKAKLLGADNKSDIALLKIEKPNNLTAITIADSDKIRVGDYVVAIGNPFGLGQTVTSGIVSALGRSMLSNNGNYENYIQTDAAVNRGNSGGALINLNGELVGINTAIIAPSGGNVGIAFAIPSSMAINLVKQIVDYGEIRRGILGIKGGELTPDLAKAFDVKTQKGAFVSEVMTNSAAEKAGLKAGDIITALNGRTINSFAELRAKIATAGAGTKVKLTYQREGKPYHTEVVLQLDEHSTGLSNNLPALKGAELSNYDKKGLKGVEIINITPKSAAQQYGLQKGDIIIGVNRKRIHNIKELNKIVDKKPSAVALHIKRGDSNFYMLVQ